MHVEDFHRKVLDRLRVAEQAGGTRSEIHNRLRDQLERIGQEFLAGRF